MSLIPLAPLKLVRYPRSLAPTLVALPSMSLIPSSSIETRSLPSSLAASLAALPSMSLIPSSSIVLIRGDHETFNRLALD